MDLIKHLITVFGIRGANHADAFIALAVVLLCMFWLLRSRARPWLVLALAIVLCVTLVVLSGEIAAFRI